MIHSPDPKPSEQPLSILIRKGVLLIVGAFIVAWAILQWRLIEL